jgi:hypothetical protein
VPFIECNQESLVFVDEVNDLVIYAHHVSKDNRAEYQEFTKMSEINEFLHKIDFGPQGVIVKPSHDFKNSKYIFKGLIKKEQIEEACKNIEKNLKQSEFWIEKDNRSHMSPKRQIVIKECTVKLIEKLICRFDKPDKEIDELWAKEAEDRIDAYDQGKLKAISLEKVLQKYR